jgi:hypothetical protein
MSRLDGLCTLLIFWVGSPHIQHYNNISPGFPKDPHFSEPSLMSIFELISSNWAESIPGYSCTKVFIAMQAKNRMSSLTFKRTSWKLVSWDHLSFHSIFVNDCQTHNTS